MKYFEEAKDIWIKYVPKEGQSETVEGELIRAIEKLRYEAQNNGNANWDRGFEYFCNYIWEVLNEPQLFKSAVIKGIRKDLNTLLINEEPYLEDDLYDRLTDHIIEWHLANNGPVKRQKDPKQYR